MTIHTLDPIKNCIDISYLRIRVLPQTNDIQGQQSQPNNIQQNSYVNQQQIIGSPRTSNSNLINQNGLENTQGIVITQGQQSLPQQIRLPNLNQGQNFQQNQIQTQYNIISQYQEQIKSLNQQLEKQNNILSEQEEQISKFIIMQKNLQNCKKQIDEQDNQIYSLKLQNEELESQLIRSKRNEIIINQKDQQLQQFTKEKQILQEQINNLKQQLSKSENQIQNSTQQEQLSQLIDKNQQLQNKNLSLLEEINSKEQLFQILVDQKTQKQQEIDSLIKQMTEYQNKLDELQNYIFQKDKIINDLRDELQKNDMVVQNLNLDTRCDQFQQLKTINDLLPHMQIQDNPQIQIFQQDPKAIKLQKQQREQKIRESENIMFEKQKQQQLQQQKLQKEQQKQQMRRLQTKILEEYGVIQICFVIDTTGSMEAYKEQVLLCISETIQEVKAQINYKIQWACVAYQDFKEYQQNNNKYNQLNFTENEKQLETFLKQQKCVDGEDYAEDIKGAFKQMLTLQWTRSFKLVMLICDAPTHGNRYNGGMPDNHSKEDIEPELIQIMQRDIFLVAINFVRYTEPMFAEFTNIYKKNQKEHLLNVVDLKKADKSTLWKQLKSIISDAAVKATQSNNAITYGRNSKIAQKNQNNDSATQAILKAGDPYNFERLNKIKVEKVSVQIYVVRFQENLRNRKDLLTKVEELKKTPIQSIHESTWECIKTEYPFAFGMIKQVYLLKKKDNDKELYVIKAPIGKDGFYNSLNEAAQDCRTHLVSQVMFDLFRQQLREKSQEKNKKQYEIVNEMKYTDLLILEQKNVKLITLQNKYFIAERFFNGEFKKYNNNFGFIEKEKSVTNEIAQAFSLFSYQASSFNYIICDIQGIGNYFTDPAICTHISNFDETDMGVEGQAKFMLSYENRKQDFKEIIQTLELEID